MTSITLKFFAQCSERKLILIDFSFKLVKFGIGQDWVPMKYDISIDMPETLDLSVLKGFGLDPSEELLPETPAPVKGKVCSTAILLRDLK